MASRSSHHTTYKPRNPAKYKGDPTRIVCRSSWERRFCYYCDTTPGILKWQSEEFCIPYAKPPNGETHRYFPDFYIEVLSTSGEVKKFVIEIKPNKETAPPKSKRRTKRFLTEAATFLINQAKWDAAKKYCAARGWTFLVITEDHLFGKK